MQGGGTTSRRPIETPPITEAQACTMMPFFDVRACDAGHPAEDLQVFQSQVFTLSPVCTQPLEEL